MRIGRLVWWRRVTVLAAVPMLSVALAVAAASASGAGSVTIYSGIDHPVAITAGPDGALWFTNFNNNSIGRITTTGTVTNYTSRAGIDAPYGITAGPDGALWFTNFGNNSIGQITTSGAVANFTGTGIDEPLFITTGADGAMWFTNYTNSLGRITTTVTPAISGFTPTSGAAGTTVTITGQNLSDATGVAFDGTAATIVSDTATQIVTEVPSGAATGRITVTTSAGTATSKSSFTVP